MDNDQIFQQIVEYSRIVERAAEEILSHGMNYKDTECPFCNKVARVQLNDFWGVVADCETPNCLHLHMNLRRNFKDGAWHVQ